MKHFATAILAGMLTASALAADYTVTPAQGWQPQIEKQITVSFSGPVAVSDAAAATVSYNIGGTKPVTDFKGGMDLLSDGNNLIIFFNRVDALSPGVKKPFAGMSSSKGYIAIEEPSEMEFKVPGSAYTVNGGAGSDLTLKYNLSATAPEVSLEHTIQPSEGTLPQIEKQIVISFTSPITVTDATAPTVSYNIGGTKAVTDFKGGMDLLADGNNLIIFFNRVDALSPGVKKPFAGMSSSKGYTTIEDPSVMQFKIPAGSYKVGNKDGEALEINYTLSTSASDPVSFAYTVDPAEGWLNPASKTFTLTFEGETAVVNADITSAKFNTKNGESTRDGLSLSASGNTLTITTKKALAIGTSGTFATTTPALAEGPVVFTLPEGSYTVDGQAGPKIELTYILSKDDPNRKPELAITPAQDSHNPSLKEVVISYGEGFNAEWAVTELKNGAIYWNSLTNGAYTGIGTKTAISVRDNSLVMTLPNDGLAPGKYEFSISKTDFKVDGKTPEEDLKFNIFVDVPNLDNAQDFAYTLTPSTTAVQNNLKTMTFTFAEGSEIVLANVFNGNCQYSWESAEAAADPANKNWFANDWTFGGCFAKDNTLQLQNSASNGLTIPDGKNQVYIYIPGGTFMVNGVYNKPINLKYYVGQAPEYFDYTVTPSKNSTVEKLDKVSLDYFDVNTSKVSFTLAEETNISLTRNEAAIEGVKVTPTTNKNVLELTVEPAQVLPGSYKFTIPAGTFFVDGLGNPETTLSYSIDYAKAEFTADPADGERLDQFKTVTLTFAEGVEIGATPVPDQNGKTVAYLNGGAWDATYTADGNKLTVELDRARQEVEDAEGNVQYKGEFTFEIRQGFYTINGIPGETITLKYEIDKNVAIERNYSPKAPTGVKYETCFVQTRVLRDYNGDRVTSVGDDGDVKVVANRGGKIHCTITNTAVNGTNIPNARLDYRILVQHKGETEAEAKPLVFSAEDGYIKWEQNADWEPKEWVPNNFTDAYDITVSLGGETDPNYHVIYFYEKPETIEQIGVQSRWTRSDVVYESEIAWTSPETPDLTGALTWEEWKALEAEYQYIKSDYTVNPKEGKKLESFKTATLTFDSNVTIAVAEEANYVMIDGEQTAATLTAEGNVLTVELAEAREEKEDSEGNVINKGEFTLQIPAGSYTVNTIPGAAISLSYDIDKDAILMDFSPLAPSGVKYETCFVQTRILRDYNGDRVESVGNNGEVKVVSNRGGKIHCTITNKAVNGTDIPNARLDYRILVQHKGETEAEAKALVFSAEDGYIKWEQNPSWEPLTWVANDFSDAYDITVSKGEGTEPNYHVIYFYEKPETIEQIGVQSRWTRSEEVYESEIAWTTPETPDLTGALTWEEWEALEAEWQKEPDTGIATLEAEGRVEYYDLQGFRVDNNCKGIVIRKIRKADGTVEVVKVIRK